MQRRRYLSLVGAGIVGLAGCAGSDEPSGGAANNAPEDTPTAADSPTATESPTETQTQTPYPEPEITTFSGTGQTATEYYTPELPGPDVFGLFHNGRRNFAVWLLDSSGQQVELLVNEIGQYSALSMYGLPQQPYSFDVTADGSWQINVGTFPIFEHGDDPAGTYNDEYASFIGPLEFAGGERVTFSAPNDGNNAVWLKNRYGERVDLLFNEIDRVDGASTRITARGVGYLDVMTNGRWSLQID